MLSFKNIICKSTLIAPSAWLLTMVLAVMVSCHRCDGQDKPTRKTRPDGRDQELNSNQPKAPAKNMDPSEASEKLVCTGLENSPDLIAERTIKNFDYSETMRARLQGAGLPTKEYTNEGYLLIKGDKSIVVLRTLDKDLGMIENRLYKEGDISYNVVENKFIPMVTKVDFGRVEQELGLFYKKLAEQGTSLYEPSMLRIKQSFPNMVPCAYQVSRQEKNGESLLLIRCGKYGVWIEPETCVFRGTVAFEDERADRVLLELFLLEVKYNAEIRPEEMEFIFPPGIKVEDVTDFAITMIKQQMK